MFDSHVHTSFSSDSNMKMKDALKKRDELGIGVILTEHMDLKCPKGDFIFDPRKYFHEYSKYRNRKLLLGIEIGMRDDSMLEYQKITHKYPFDYVLGSIHYVDNIDIYFKSFYQGRSKKECYERYFISMINCLKQYNFIDSLGHIDYISRYAPYDDSEINFNEFGDYIDQVFKLVIERDKALEINTRRFKSKKAQAVLKKLYIRYNEMGGKYVTIGSDAHISENIGNYINDAVGMASECNLRPVYFNNRKMEYLI